MKNPIISVIYPGDENQSSITLNWQNGENKFSVEIGNDEIYYVEIPVDDNMYIAAAIMTDWLDRWVEENEDSEVNQAGPGLV